jgi:hypothetical protein
VCVRKSQGDTDDGALVVIRADATGGIKLDKIGEMRDGIAAVTMKDGDALVEGRPVFCAQQVVAKPRGE